MRFGSFYIADVSNWTSSKIILASFLFFFLPSIALGASLSFSPAAGSYAPGIVFNVGINVNSGGEALNAASGVVSFPTDLLEVVSISKNQSIMSLWVQEPFFSNSQGTINFEGIVLNPGFNGTSGRVLNVTFKAKAEGRPVLAFTSGSVLANDGEGSEILASRDKAQYSITAPVIVPEVETSPALEEARPVLDEGNPALLPQLISPSNPLDGWSKQTNGVFNFSFPSSVTSMRLLLDEKPDSIPTVVYTPPIASKEIKDLEEGTSYLHVQYKDAQGWGEVLHHKIQIDTKAPESFVAKEIAPGTFLFEANDSLSGIARYEIQIDGGEVIEFIDDGSHTFEVPDLAAGKYTLFVKAFDAAGNFITNTLSFEAPASIPEVPVPQAQTQAQTPNPVPVEVLPTPGFLVPNGAILITVLSIVIPSLALIMLLGALLYAAWSSVGGLRRRIDKEVKEANLIVHKAFMILKSDLELDIETLKKANKKRKLTREESKILKRLQKNLDEAEKVISKEVTDIEDELT